MLFEDKMNFVLKKREVFINLSVTEFEELKSSSQKLELDECLDSAKIARDLNFVSNNNNFMIIIDLININYKFCKYECSFHYIFIILLHNIKVSIVNF